MHRQLARDAAAVSVQDLKIRLVEFGAAHRVVDAGIALDAQLRIFEIDPALDRHFAGLVIVVHRVRSHGARVLTDRDPAVHRRVALGIDHRFIAFDVDEMIVFTELYPRRCSVLGGGGAHITGLNHRSGRKIRKNSQCGPNVRSHGQSESP